MKPLDPDSRLRNQSAARSVWQFGQDLRISTFADSPLHQAMQYLFAPLKIEQDSDSDDSLELELREASGKGWHLCAGGLPLHTIQKLNQVVPAVESLITHLFARTQSHVQVLHMGMVGWDYRAVLLPGDRGSGKSTLSLALAQAGAAYYGDDLIAYEPGADAFYSLPKAVTLKIGSFPLFADGPTYEDPMRGPVRYVLPDTAVVGSVPWENVACIVFPEYSRSGGEVQRLSPGWTALALVQQLLGGVEWNDEALRLVGRMAQLPAYRLPFNQLDHAIVAVQNLVKETDCAIKC